MIGLQFVINVKVFGLLCPQTLNNWLINAYRTIAGISSKIGPAYSQQFPAFPALSHHQGVYAVSTRTGLKRYGRGRTPLTTGSA